MGLQLTIQSFLNQGPLFMAFRTSFNEILAATRPAGRGQWVATGAAVVLVALWAGFWVEAARRGAVPEGASRLAWTPALPVLGADFRSVDHVARLYGEGRDPTALTDDWICMLYPYPPFVNRAFGWVRFMSTESALSLWLVALTGIYSVGAVAGWRSRRELRLSALPLAVVVAAVLCSTPALLALERGQIDPLVIPILVVAAWLLREKSAGRELLAGGLLGAAAWLKYYPGVVLFGLLALKKPKAAAAFVLVAGVIGVVDQAEVRRAVEIGGRWTTIHEKEKTLSFVHATKHAVADAWRPLWVRAHRPWRYLGRVPDAWASVLLLIPPVVLVSLRLARREEPGPLILPYFLWLTAAATFAMPTSIDYSLVPLPLAALAVWDRRDRLAVQVGLGVLLLWWQPFALPLDGRLVFVAKLAGFYAVGASLSARAVAPAALGSEIRSRHFRSDAVRPRHRIGATP
jgi:Glycosyltransferase family 87